MSPQSRLDQLLENKLPQSVIKSIEDVAITLEDAARWHHNSVPRFRVVITPKRLSIAVNIDTSLKRGLAAFGTAIGALASVTVFVVKYWPIVEALLRAKP